MTATDEQIAQILAQHNNGNRHAPVVVEHQPVGWWQRRRDPEGAQHDDIQRANAHLTIQAMTAAANAGAVARHVTTTYTETLRDIEATVTATSRESGLVEAYVPGFTAKVISSTERTLGEIVEYAQAGQLARIKALR